MKKRIKYLSADGNSCDRSGNAPIKEDTGTSRRLGRRRDIVPAQGSGGGEGLSIAGHCDTWHCDFQGEKLLN
jgi:hypothetical protein